MSDRMIEPIAVHPLLDTSMTKLDTWSRCDRRFYYRYVLGLKPIAVDWKVQWGSLWHRVAQVFYGRLKEGAHVDTDAAFFSAQTEAEQCELIENQFHGNSEITLTDQQREELWQTFLYYMDQTGRHDAWDEIVAVEQPVYLTVNYAGTPILRIRSTLDMLVWGMHEGKRRLIPVDHKTTGNVQQNLLFLGLDLQVRIYSMSVAAIYGEDPLMCYNMIAREVPPGFRTRPLETASGKKRNAATLESMQNPQRYLRRAWLSYTPEQYASFQRTLIQDATILQKEAASGVWPRRVVKMGPLACDGCPYFSICTAELGGRTFNADSALLTMSFTKDPLV
jgi:hypothetical protein